MEANQYQNQTQDTAVYPGRHTPSGLNYTVLGLVGEAGELANKLKKIYRNEESVYMSREVLVDELGDVLWYAAAFAKELGVSFEEVMEKNLAKLQARKAAGTLKNRPAEPEVPKKRSCNRHVDCDHADAAAKTNGFNYASHCHDDECEDCFGK